MPLRPRKIPVTLQTAAQVNAKAHALILQTGATAKVGPKPTAKLTAAAASSSSSVEVPQLDFSRMRISPKEDVPASFSKRSRQESGRPSPRDASGRAPTGQQQQVLEKRTYYDARLFPNFRPYGNVTDKQMKWFEASRLTEPMASDTLGSMLENGQEPDTTGGELQLSRPQDEADAQHVLPPISTSVGLAANAGKSDTMAGVILSTIAAVRAGAGELAPATAASSADSAAAYEQAHTAEAVAATKTDTKSRIGQMYEAQVARAVQDTYYTWQQDKAGREELCRVLGESSSSSATPMLTDSVDYTYQ